MISWINRTELTGSSIDPSSTTSHTCTLTAAMVYSLTAAYTRVAVRNNSINGVHLSVAFGLNVALPASTIPLTRVMGANI